MFRTRLISGIMLVILAALGIIAGGWIWAGMLCFISVNAYLELTRATPVHTEGKALNALEITGMVLIVCYYLPFFLTDLILETLGGKDFLQVLFKLTILIIAAYCMILALLVFMVVYVYKFPGYKAGQVMAAYFEFIYAPVLLSFLYMIRETWNSGAYLMGLVFLCSWGSDTCAYCVGVLFGKHKMTPKLSPKKSIEGAIGGIVGSALLCGLYTHYVLNVYAKDEFAITVAGAVLLGVIGAFISMIGDLVASAIKRDYDIKDYGKLIPGHGGIMDRFDSVIIVAPLIFFYVYTVDVLL